MLRSHSLLLAACLVSFALPAAACPADKAMKGKTGTEANMSKPSAKFAKAQKSVKPGHIDNTSGEDKLPKPNA